MTRFEDLYVLSISDTQVGVLAPPQLLSTASNAAVSSSTPVTSNSGTKKLPATTYVDLHLSKLTKAADTTYNTISVVPKSQHQILRKSSFGGLTTTGEKPASIQTSNSDVGFSKHDSLSERNILREHNSNISMIVSHPSEEQVHHSEPQAAVTAGLGGPAPSMSLTWPRTNLGGLSTGGGSGSGGLSGLTSVPPLKGPVQINADALGAASGKHNDVSITSLFMMSCDKLQFRIQ